MIKLAGVLVMVVGLLLRWNTLAVVLGAGIATGLIAGLSFNEIMTLFGRMFVESRYMTLPIVLMVAVLGLLERYGLQERAAALIRGARAATAGRVLLLYTAVRQISISVGVNIGGHPQTVRPLVAPMAEGAARARHGELSEKTVHAIRAHAAAAENVGNFFGEDIFIAVGGILLMKGFFEAQKVEVSVWRMALWGIPTALVAFGVFAWRCRRLDRVIARAAGDAAAKTEGKR